MAKFIFILLFASVFVTRNDVVIYSADEEMFRLGSLIKEAVEKNPGVIAAKNKFEAKKQRVPQSRALADPMVGVGFENMPDNNFSIGSAPMEIYSVSQEIPFPTKLFSRSKMAKREAGVAEQELREEILSVGFDVARVYYELLYAHNAIEINREAKGLWESSIDAVFSRYRAARAAQGELLKSEIELAKVENELFLLENQKNELSSKLNILLNRHPDTPVGKPLEKPPSAFDASLKSLYEMAKAHRPELKAAKLKIEKTEIDHSMAVQEYLPDFEMKVSRRQMRNDATTYDTMFGLSLPLWFWERQAPGVREKKKELEGSLAEYNSMENRVLYDVSRGYSEVVALKRSIGLFSTVIIPQAEQSLEGSQAGYEAGKEDFLSFLDSQRMLLDSKLEYYRLLTRYEIALADLYFCSVGSGIDYER
mgnify:CR=1 FL=1